MSTGQASRFNPFPQRLPAPEGFRCFSKGGRHE